MEFKVRLYRLMRTYSTATAILAYGPYESPIPGRQILEYDASRLRTRQDTVNWQN
jgi:hypothetical protein